MTEAKDYRVGTLILGRVLIDSNTFINVQLMRREARTGEPSCWVSAVPLGPMAVYVVNDRTVTVQQVLFEPEPPQIEDWSEPGHTIHLVSGEFDDGTFVFLAPTNEGKWQVRDDECSENTDTWDGWMMLWRQHDVRKIHLYEKMGERP